MTVFSTPLRRRRILSILGSVLCVLITLELATRLFRPDFESVTKFDAELGMTLKPSLSQAYFDNERRQTIQMRTNSLGLRGPEYAIPKPDNLRRIAVFGDSYTEARAFEEHETFCGRLQSLLQAERSENSPLWEVMNVGSSGYGTSTELALYRQKIKAYEPDVVIVCFTPGTDLFDNSTELNRAPIVCSRLDDAGRVELVPPPAVSVNRGLKNWSQLYRWQKEKGKMLVDSFREKHENPSRRVVQITQVPPSAPIERAWKLTEQLLREFRAEVESQGAEFCVVTIPHCWQIQPDQFEAMRSTASDSDQLFVDYPVSRLTEMCDEHGISLINLTEPFRQAYPYEDSSHEEAWLFLNGRGHFNSRGHELAATELYRFIQRHSSFHRDSIDRIATQLKDTSSR